MLPDSTKPLGKPMVTYVALKWFENNHIKANPSKVQAALFKCHKNDEVFDLNIGDVCTILVAVLCSFLLLITPSSLICTFSSPFSLCHLIALG